MNETTCTRPIGYWLRRADQLMTARAHEAPAANDVSRTDWQVLNLLHDAGSRATQERLLDTLRSFVDSAHLDEIVSRLMHRGWLAFVETSPAEPAHLQFTPEGRRRYRAIAARQRQVRRQTLEGVSEEEHATFVRVLQRIVANLETTPPAPRRRQGMRDRLRATIFG